MPNLRRYHRGNFTVREARRKAALAFQEEIRDRLDFWVEVIFQADTSDPSWTFSGFRRTAQACWDRYADRVCRIAGACGLTTSEVLGDLPRWPG